MPRDFSKNPLKWDENANLKPKDRDYEQELKWLKKFWDSIGMNREPTLEDVKNPTTLEEETIRMLRIVFPNRD